METDCLLFAPIVQEEDSFTKTVRATFQWPNIGKLCFEVNFNSIGNVSANFFRNAETVSGRTQWRRVLAPRYLASNKNPSN